MTAGLVLRRPPKPMRGGQRGIVMWVAIVVLIVMTIAGLAMLRQMGTGVSIAGNMAMKENATSVADSGTEVGRQWVMAQPVGTLDNDVPASGYFATWGASVDPTTFDWTNAGSVAVALDAGTGNAVRYVVHRLCQNTGPVTAVTQRCSDLEDNTGGSKEGLSYGVGAPPQSLRAYFRVTVQVLGPRNTVSYTQVVLS
jgi:type IV pilus assembly protein PilX